MGCQGSKAAGAAAPTPQPPTLLSTDASAKMLAKKDEALVPSSVPVPSSQPPCPKEQSSHRVTRKEQTRCTDRHELDVMVSQFTSHDSTVGNAVGRNCKDLRWKVMFDIDAAPIDIALHVQEHKLHSNEVSIECNGQAIFCGAGSHAKAKMTEDFCCEWPIRGAIRGINERNCFELRPSHLNSQMWLPATITGQRSDGFFEVTAQQADAQGFLRAVKYPAVNRADLREAKSKKPLVVPESCLMLHVPKQDPLQAVLSVDSELVTHHFGRPSPSPSVDVSQKPKINLQVSHDRRVVTTDVGHGVLSHFASGEVRSVKSEVQRLAHSWTVQLGPFAEHSVKIVKNHTLGKIVTLMVDGEVFVESSAADIGCQANEWQCSFHFVGERTLDFEVYKTNKDGYALDETDHVVERRKYLHKCSVIIPNDWDLSTAKFFVDGTDFLDLPIMPQLHPQEPSLSMEPTALMRSYGITVPYKVDHTAPSGIAYLTNHILTQAETGKKAASGFFAWCCESTTDPKSAENIENIVCEESASAQP